MGIPDINEAHKKLLGELAPVSNELSELTFGFAAAMFKKYLGPEMTLTVVAKLADAPNIDHVLIPYFVETDHSVVLNG